MPDDPNLRPMFFRSLARHGRHSLSVLTTRDCADLLSEAAGLDGAFTARFVWGEIADGRLIARVNHRGETRQRARIRIHPDDFAAYCDRNYERLSPAVRSRLFHAER